jgi:hypothetical protein
VVIEFLPERRVENSSLAIGIELIFIAIGFLTYFFYVKDKEVPKGRTDGA